MISVILGDDDITDEVIGLQWSSTDPGGFESCTFSLPNQRAGDHLGETVIVYEGLEVVFQGRVNEPGSDYTAHKGGAQQFNAVGARAVLSDNQKSMVFIDRELGNWRGVGLARTAALDPAWVLTSFESQVDVTNGGPGLKLDTTGSVKGTSGILCEAWYDAGLGNLIHAFIVQTDVSGAATNFQVVSCADDTATVSDALVASTAVAVAETLYTLANDRRFLDMQAFSSTVSTTPRFRTTTKVAVIGDHGLTLRGASDARGYYPGEVAQWVASEVGDLATSIAVDPNTYIIPHLVYRTPVTWEQIVSDAALLLGWHWGVWEPSGIASTTPVLHFKPPPTDATVFINVGEVGDLQLSQQLSEMYNAIRVSYTDVAGVPAYTTVTRSVPRLGSLTRTVDVNLGTSSLDVAQKFGADYLALVESSGRAVGQCTLPPMITTQQGKKRSHLVKPGRDRLKLVGLQDTTASLLETDNRRFDTFRISRITSSQQSDGSIQSVAELDAGANLLEVLNARLAIATQLAGV